MTDTAHTPTPWEFKNHGHYFNIYQFADPQDHACTTTLQNAKANAAFIVRAANCHDELIELLKRAIEGRPTQEPCHPVLGKNSVAYKNWQLWNDMRNALAKAGAV